MTEVTSICFLYVHPKYQQAIPCENLLLHWPPNHQTPIFRFCIARFYSDFPFLKDCNEIIFARHPNVDIFRHPCFWTIRHRTTFVRFFWSPLTRQRFLWLLAPARFERSSVCWVCQYMDVLCNYLAALHFKIQEYQKLENFFFMNCLRPPNLHSSCSCGSNELSRAPQHLVAALQLPHVWFLWAIVNPAVGAALLPELTFPLSCLRTHLFINGTHTVEL